MNLNKTLRELHIDYWNLAEKYSDRLECYEFGYALIQLNVKLLMDNAPRHGVALETIKTATESGIKWHVEEREQTKQGQ